MSENSSLQGVQALKKHKMRTSSIVFMIYCLVAAGAFGIEEMIPASGPGMTLLMLIIFPIIWAWPISGIVSEMASILPEEGGLYVWAKTAFGEFWGFQANWWNTIAIYVGNGVYVSLAVDYMSKFFPMTEAQACGIKVAMILIFTFINLLGIEDVGNVSTIFSIIILAAFTMIMVVGFCNWNQNPFEPMIPADSDALTAIGDGIGICVWMYCGYECISTMSGEVSNPRVVPKGLLIAMPIIALTYVLPTVAGLASVGSWEDWSTSSLSGIGVGYDTVLSQYMGYGWGVAFLVVAIIGQCAIFNTYLAAGGRGFFVFADDNMCPRVLVKVSKKRGVPYVGILVLAVFTMIMSQLSFKSLVMIEVIFDLCLYMILPLACIKLRKMYPAEERKKAGHYVMPGGTPGMWIMCLLPLTISVAALLLNGTDYFVIGLFAMFVGPLIYIVLKKVYGGLSVRDPEGNPVNPKTGLAKRDFFRFALYNLLLSILATVGRIWLGWWEWEYAFEDLYYIETYGENNFFGNFDAMMLACVVVAALAAALALIFFLAGRRIDSERGPVRTSMKVFNHANGEYEDHDLTK